MFNVTAINVIKYHFEGFKFFKNLNLPVHVIYAWFLCLTLVKITVDIQCYVLFR